VYVGHHNIMYCNYPQLQLIIQYFELNHTFQINAITVPHLYAPQWSMVYKYYNTTYPPCPTTHPPSARPPPHTEQGLSDRTPRAQLLPCCLFTAPGQTGYRKEEEEEEGRWRVVYSGWCVVVGYGRGIRYGST